jgi:hypothetical protein
MSVEYIIWSFARGQCSGSVLVHNMSHNVELHKWMTYILMVGRNNLFLSYGAHVWHTLSSHQHIILGPFVWRVNNLLLGLRTLRSTTPVIPCKTSKHVSYSQVKFECQGWCQCWDVSKAGEKPVRRPLIIILNYPYCYYITLSVDQGPFLHINTNTWSLGHLFRL